MPRTRHLLSAAVAGAALIAAPVLAAAPAHATTSDPLRGQQWSLNLIRAEQAWPKSTGAGVVVAVVDTGVDLTHPDLQGQLVPGITAVGCPDGETFCSDGNWLGVDGVGQDNDSHGTHVSGIIAAATDNGIGVAGVAPDARIMPVKVLEDGSGTTTDIAHGIHWAVDHGADVVNMSLGGEPLTELLTVVGLDSEWTEAVDYATAHGVLVIAAAGNSTYPFCSSPANVRGVICVTSVGPNGLPAYYSNQGLGLNFDTVAGPGGNGLTDDGDVLSTVPGGYAAYAGTSMATPAVVGVAALLYAQGRSLSEVHDAIVKTAKLPLLGLSGLFTPSYGYGIVDAAAAVNYSR